MAPRVLLPAAVSSMACRFLLTASTSGAGLIGGWDSFGRRRLFRGGSVPSPPTGEEGGRGGGRGGSGKREENIEYDSFPHFKTEVEKE